MVRNTLYNPLMSNGNLGASGGLAKTFHHFISCRWWMVRHIHDIRSTIYNRNKALERLLSLSLTFFEFFLFERNFFQTRKKTSGTMEAINNYTDQPFFVVNDAAYDRMYEKLKQGSRFEWSYQGTCPHPPGSCVCPRFMNVIKDDTIIRIVNGKQKPVYKASEFMAMHPSTELGQVVNIFVDRFAFNPAYASTIKEAAASWKWPSKVNINMDAESPPSFTLNCTSYAKFVDLVDGLSRL